MITAAAAAATTTTTTTTTITITITTTTTTTTTTAAAAAAAATTTTTMIMAGRCDGGEEWRQRVGNWTAVQRGACLVLRHVGRFCVCIRVWHARAHEGSRTRASCANDRSPPHTRKKAAYKTEAALKLEPKSQTPNPNP